MSAAAGSFLSRSKRRLVIALCGTLVGVKTDERVAALTFDDGPDPEFTPRLLDLLARHRTRATFFVIGLRAAAHPGLIRRIADEGHAIGNHSWDHPRFTSLTGSQRRSQISSCRRAIGPGGSRLFRPPYGTQTLESQISLLPLRHMTVGWNADAEDWMPHDQAWIADRLRTAIRPGCIVLLHDALFKPRAPDAADRSPLFAALDTVLTELASSVRFVTIPELLERGRPKKVLWERQDDTATSLPEKHVQWQ